MPKVSVVIPCYNYGRFLDDAVDSVLNQTERDVEILIVNDGSTDQFTIDKLQHYSKPKICVIHTENRGPSAARNTGIAAANSAYILTLDADDWFEATFIEHALAVLERSPEVGVVTCGLQNFGANTKRHYPYGGDVRNFLVRGAVIGSVLFRKICWEQSGGYDERMKTSGYEDWNFILDVTKRGWIVHVLPEYLLHYRQHRTSRRIRSHDNRIENIRQIVQNHRTLFQEYVEEAILGREKKIQELRREKQRLLDSWEYRVGSLLLWPLRTLERLAKTLKKRLLP